MTIGTIKDIDAKGWATVDVYGETMLFNVRHASVAHGYSYHVGQQVSIRMSRNNLQVASVVPADAEDLGPAAA